MCYVITVHPVLNFEVMDDGVKISYQITKEAGPGGIVSSRDFILIYKIGRKGNGWMQGKVVYLFKLTLI